ncbi:MAG TPA: GNAT family N-acetyltransferase [Gemmatimonadaceae bacterium]|nr:GNAT family N-acetyltransferase [Gemmatimonadaceae bacterium]
MPDIRVESLSPKDVAEASRVLARAFVTNPLHVAAFGAGALARNEAFFLNGLAVMKGPKLVALEGSRVLGVLHWVHSPECQIAGLEKLRLVPVMLRSFGVGGATHMGNWLSAWAKHDPKEPHSHLGPIGVEPVAQGRHIGQLLMEHYCEDADRIGAIGYLETDRPENVEFYRRFGFEVTDEAPVLGVPNFFMQRAVSTGSVGRSAH